MIGVAAIAHYADHPADFVHDILRVEPTPAQRTIMDSVARNRFTTVRSGHGIGKSAVEAWLILWFLCTRPHPKIPCTAPTQHQLQDILWSEIAKWMRGCPALESVLKWTKERVYMRAHPETWFAVARTAATPDAMQGFHAENVLYVIDEASGVSDSVFEPVIGAMTTPGSRLIMCGNPTRLTGFFHASHTRSRALYAAHHVDASASPLVSRSFVEQIVEMYGADSDVFRVRVSGDFPRAQADSFIMVDWCEAASEREMEPIANPSRVDIGIDGARFGDDSSVIVTLLDRAYELPIDIYHHRDTMQLTGHAVELIRRMAAEYPQASIMVKVDCDGMGAGVYDRLNEQIESLRAELDKDDMSLDVIECHFGGAGGKLQEGDSVEYANSTGLMWGAVREALRRGELTLQPSRQQISQLSNRRFAINSAGRIELERKESMKKNGFPSPDIADALALAMWTPWRPSFTFF